MGPTKEEEEEEEARAVPFDIDLNETPPASSPPAAAGKGAGGSSGEDRKGKSVLLDINAIPSDEEGEERDKRGELLSSYARMNVVRDASSTGNSNNSSVTCSNLLFVGNQYDHKRAYDSMPSIIRSGITDFLPQRPVIGGSLKDGDVFPVLLRRHWPGGSSVCTFPFLNSNGMQLESMFDVARHLSLVTSCHALLPQGRSEEFDLPWNTMQLHRGRKESSTLSRTKDLAKFQESSKSNFPVELSLGAEIMDPQTYKLKDSVKVGGDGYRETDDCPYLQRKVAFPVQFEDFFVLSAGEVDPRSSYRSESQIWPVGYRSSWHDKITGSVFVCDVSDGGNAGPVFKVQRYPCCAQNIVEGSTILLRASPSAASNNVLSPVGMDIDEDIDLQMIFFDLAAPCLDSSNLSDIDVVIDVISDAQPVNDLLAESNCTTRGLDVGRPNIMLGDDIGEFLVEGRSSSSVWTMVSQKLVDACHMSYKQTGRCNLQCMHDNSGVQPSDVVKGDRHVEIPIDSLAKYCFLSGPMDAPHHMRSDDEFATSCQALTKWLDQDRFGLDVDFVQEIIEQLPGVRSFSDYVALHKRIELSELQTIGNGFLLAKRCIEPCSTNEEDVLGECTKPKKQAAGHLPVKDHCPPCNCLNSQLPASLIGDVLQLWELLWRFSEVLELEELVSFSRLEEELLDCPLSTSRFSASTARTQVHHVSEPAGTEPLEEVPKDRLVPKSCIGEHLTRAHCSMLKLLFSELQSKVAMFVDPSFENGEFKSRKRRKIEGDNMSCSKKAMLDLLPINELTWPELARRYLLSVSSMEGNLDSVEIFSRESCKVFHCLQGHREALGGSSPPGVAGMEADALLLAEAAKQIYGLSTDISEELKVNSNDSDAPSAGKLSNGDEGEIPEWAKVLEPVRKLPTNVGARIRNCVKDALSKNPPAWARRKLDYSISKEVYKGNASGPTKRAVLALLAELLGEDGQQKPARKRKHKLDGSVSDLIMKKCQRVLRLSVAADEGKVFCNSLGRSLVSASENDDERILGGPVMVSRPLDFRSIDVRLACGVYGGSHEAFLEDVREVNRCITGCGFLMANFKFGFCKVWNHIPSAFAGRPDLIHLAKKLSQKFESLYDKEVLTLVHKLADLAGEESIGSETQKEMESVTELIGEMPKAPWDEGVCKVCAVDRDDCKVLLCDKCDSGYHTYCLNPPLAKVPVGNWYCPSCADGPPLNQVPQFAGQTQKRRRQGDITNGFLETLSRLYTAMEVKDYWEYTVEERILLLKILGDELLSSSCIREHLEHCASVSMELQQKLRSLLAEWQNFKLREELVARKLAKANGSMATGAGISRTGGFDLETNDRLAGLTLTSGQQLPASYYTMHLENGLHSKLQAKKAIAKESRLFNSHGVVGQHSISGQCCFNKNLESDCLADQPSCEENGHALENGHAKADLTKNGSVPKKLKYDTDGDDAAWRNCKQDMESNSGQTRMFPVFSIQRADFSLASGGSHIAAKHEPSVPVNSDNLLSGCFIRHNPEIQSCEVEADFTRNRIFELQESIARIKFQLEKISMRKDLLGCDAVGRRYWTFSRPRSSPFVVVDAAVGKQHNVELVFSSSLRTENVITSKSLDGFSQYKSQQGDEIPLSSRWFFYQSDAEIEELVNWLKDKGPAERSLLVSLLEHLNFKFKDPFEPENPGQQPPLEPTNARSPSDLNSPVTRALAALEKKYGPLDPNLDCSASARKVSKITEVTSAERLFRCGCLEPVWPGRNHCQMCHHSFSNKDQLKEHNNGKCRSLRTSQTVKVNNNEEKMEVTRSSEGGPPDSTICESAGSGDHAGTGMVGSDDTDCPYDIEEISARFITNNSNIDLVKAIGLLGSEGVPSFVPSSAPYLNDPSLKLASLIEFGVEQNVKSRNAESGSKCRILQSRSASGNKSPILQKLGNLNDYYIRDSSLKPLVGRGRQILRQLKINLLDMDAALPHEALKPSKACLEKRCAWQTFVKSANSVFEMVQATIVFEDMIKTEFLKNEWWYWSPLSAASKIATVSSVALRLYTLDAAIAYEVPVLSTKEAEAGSTDIKMEYASAHLHPKPLDHIGKNGGSASFPKPSSKPVPKTASVDPSENSKPRSKKKKHKG